MILNLGSLAFNADLEKGGGTPAWGTELGQGDGYKFSFEDMSDFFTGMVYSSVSDIENVTCPLGKGGNARDDYDFVIASLFKKIYVNGKRVPNAQFILLVIKKLVGENHVGRRTIKYNPRMTYRGREINDDCYKKMATAMQLNANSAWFVHEILIRNQDELHFIAYELGKRPKTYATTDERKNAFLSKLPKDGTRLFYVEEEDTSKLLQKIYYGTPGSGKSHKVKDLVEAVYPDENERDNYVFRTTFHPDSDYASFVGCYKPQMNDGAITYEFVPQAFTKAYVQAWNNPDKPVYLIVEEINRGNCAQIFGDLFQLLDRKGGVSEYPIDADDDLHQYLEKELNEAGKAGIANGKIKLPKNLNILATMNTSDQSLFPMDSAFKRRWRWECVPIDYNNPDSGAFTISLGEKEYNWHEFLKMVNELIRKATDSEDKQMGNFFIDGDVDESQFINKVMFYLWNDVCKEEFGTKNNFFRYYTDSNGTEKEFSFNDLFGTDAHNILVKFMVHTGFKDDGEQPNNEESETEVE